MLPGTAIGAAFNQVINQELKPLAFFSRKLTAAEIAYSTFDRELLAIYAIVKKHRILLIGRSVIVQTDHKPLTYLLQQRTDKLTARQTRHISLIAEYVTQICYVKGELNSVADALSRIAVISIEPGIVSHANFQRLQEQDRSDNNDSSSLFDNLLSISSSSNKEPSLTNTRC